MRKVFTTFLLLLSVLTFQFCASSKKAANAPAITYQANVLPIIQASCTPCHIAGKGNKKSLDNYIAAKDFADEILTRIQKNPTEHGFMPMRNSKLSDASIATFIAWKKTGLLN